MKTTFITTMVVTVFSIIASGSLWAAPYSKQMNGNPAPRHENEKCVKSGKNDTAKKPTGPASKRF